MSYENVIETINKTNAFGTLLGIQIDRVEEGFARVSLDIVPDYLNPYKTVHGGVLYTMADMAGGTAAYSHGQAVVTVDSSFHFLHAGRDVTKLIAEGREIRNGKSIAVYEVSVMNQEEKELCRGTFTYAKISEKQSGIKL